MMHSTFCDMVMNWSSTEKGWFPKFRRYFNEDIDLRLGIGINYGPAAFDFYGSNYYREYAAIGDTVNTAERLKESANKSNESDERLEPILISQTAFTRVEPFIQVTKHLLNLRGKAIPVSAYGLREFNS